MQPFDLTNFLYHGKTWIHKHLAKVIFDFEKACCFLNGYEEDFCLES